MDTQAYGAQVGNADTSPPSEAGGALPVEHTTPSADGLHVEPANAVPPPAAEPVPQNRTEAPLPPAVDKPSEPVVEPLPVSAPSGTPEITAGHPEPVTHIEPSPPEALPAPSAALPAAPRTAPEPPTPPTVREEKLDEQVSLPPSDARMRTIQTDYDKLPLTKTALPVESCVGRNIS